jgi:hypothetical protein
MAAGLNAPLTPSTPLANLISKLLVGRVGLEPTTGGL